MHLGKIVLVIKNASRVGTHFLREICSYGGIIHPVEKVGVTDHPGAN